MIKTYHKILTELCYCNLLHINIDYYEITHYMYRDVLTYLNIFNVTYSDINITTL